MRMIEIVEIKIISPWKEIENELNRLNTNIFNTSSPLVLLSFQFLIPPFHSPLFLFT